jgi:hypothetical protein
MKNKSALMDLVTRAERGALLPGEATLLRDAIELLDDLATTLDKLTGGHVGDYETTTTQSMRVIPEYPRPWREDPPKPGRPLDKANIWPQRNEYLS